MYNKLKYALLTVFTVFAATANAAPMAFSVNSDSGKAGTEDSLHLIDLATGEYQLRGRLKVGTQTRLDTEGLAFAPDGTLWGLDDEVLTMFPINTNSGAIRVTDEVQLQGFSALGGNDFGMTFSCDNRLYATSVVLKTLYILSLDGTSQVVGSIGALGYNISAIASIGDPVRIYGLGNGQLADGTPDAPSLFSIDPLTGVAKLIGPLGPAVGEYGQGGLSFDADGGLWAITDRSVINNKVANQPSQILKIDPVTGTATLISETKGDETGFESLAIAPPSQCTPQPPAARPGASSEFPAIPALSSNGRSLATLLIMLIGFVMLRRHATN